jgi:hypothetical protein
MHLCMYVYVYIYIYILCGSYLFVYCIHINHVQITHVRKFYISLMNVYTYIHTYMPTCLYMQYVYTYYMPSSCTDTLIHKETHIINATSTKKNTLSKWRGNFALFTLSDFSREKSRVFCEEDFDGSSCRVAVTGLAPFKGVALLREELLCGM